MAGTVALPGERRWSTSSQVFYWLVDTAADVLTADQPAADRPATDMLAARLREVSEHNLGWLGVDGLPEPERTRLLTLLASMPELADERLPPGAPGHDAIVEQLRELAELAREA